MTLIILNYLFIVNALAFVNLSLFEQILLLIISI